MFYSCFTFSKYIFIKFFRYINMKQNLNSKNKVRKLNHKVMGEKISCVTEERRVMKNVKWKNRETIGVREEMGEKMDKESEVAK